MTIISAGECVALAGRRNVVAVYVSQAQAVTSLIEQALTVSIAGV
jgi:hypothetical protein